MEVSEIYSTCRTRLIELAPSLTADQLAVSLPPTPPWVVLDGYRHLTGVCADVLDGVMDGAGSPAWTAVQLANRQHKSVEEVCEEWSNRAPDLERRIADAGTAMAFLAFDAWTHGQDVRAAAGLDRAGDDDDGELVSTLASVALTTLGRRYSAQGGPPLKVVFGGRESILGEGEPTVTLDTTAYELLRIIFGRRSRAQVEAASWSGGDVSAAIEAIHLFDFPVVDISD